jgi:hypothetical protein
MNKAKLENCIKHALALSVELRAFKDLSVHWSDDGCVCMNIELKENVGGEVKLRFDYSDQQLQQRTSRRLENRTFDGHAIINLEGGVSVAYTKAVIITGADSVAKETAFDTYCTEAYGLHQTKSYTRDVITHEVISEAKPWEHEGYAFVSEDAKAFLIKALDKAFDGDYEVHYFEFDKEGHFVNGVD